ncbi:MAG: O-antigen ligase family protein [Nodosilinea sp.]
MTQALQNPSPNAAQRQTNPGEKQGQVLMIAWAVVVGVCLAVGAGQLLIVIFPLGSLLVGLFLYFRAPVLYISFTLWMIFLGTLVRKIIDYQSGYVTPGRWGFPALLVASIALITLVKQFPKTHRQGGLPFVISVLGLSYAFLVGIASDSLSPRYLIGAVEWFVPLAFGFHLFSQWRQYPAYRQIILTTFIWGTLVMGVYALYQYYVAPGWDTFYLAELEVTSFGTPEPFKLRVWSTSTSPQEFSALMLAGIILIFSGQGVVRFAAAGVGYLGFILTMSRSGWLGWCAAMLMFLPFVTLKLQMRLMVTILAIALVVIPFTQMEPFASVIGERIESFSSVDDDQSLRDRTEGYQALSKDAFSEFIGLGLGNMPKIGTPLGGSDSSIFPLLFGLGWVGTVPYVGGILLILMKLFGVQQFSTDPFASASRAIALAIFAQLALNQIFTNVFGYVLWGFLGISLAAVNYHQYNPHRRNLPSSSHRD